MVRCGRAWNGLARRASLRGVPEGLYHKNNVGHKPVRQPLMSLNVTPWVHAPRVNQNKSINGGPLWG